MSAIPTCPTDVELLKRLLLDMSQERSVDNVLKLIVDRLASQTEVALARIWLVGPGDICGTPGSLEDAIGELSLYQRSAGKYSKTIELITAMNEGNEEAAVIWESSGSFWI